MSDRLGVLCCIIHIIGAVVGGAGVATGTWELILAGMAIYLGFGALTIRYVAE